jgi:uncharacterized membrane protein YfcA
MVVAMNFSLYEATIVASVFVVAGLVKGAIGLGLPTISMGLLGALMAPGQAAAILIVPALATNAWQIWDGPALKGLVQRLWPVLVCTLLGTLAAAGILTKVDVRLTGALLGAILIVYSITGLSGLHFKVAPRSEPIMGALVGLITGLINGATGIFVVPAVPYIQALGLSKDELVQALAISAFVSSIALGLGLQFNNGLTNAVAIPAVIGLAASFVGMAIGKALRSRLSADIFRRFVLIGLLALGATMICRYIL